MRRRMIASISHRKGLSPTKAPQTLLLRGFVDLNPLLARHHVGALCRGLSSDSAWGAPTPPALLLKWVRPNLANKNCPGTS